MHVGAVNFAASLTVIVQVYNFCLACTSRIGTWFPCSLAVSMSVVFLARFVFAALQVWSSHLLVTVGLTTCYVEFSILVDNTELSTLEIARRHVTHLDRFKYRKKSSRCHKIRYRKVNSCTSTVRKTVLVLYSD